MSIVCTQSRRGRRRAPTRALRSNGNGAVRKPGLPLRVWRVERLVNLEWLLASPGGEEEDPKLVILGRRFVRNYKATTGAFAFLQSRMDYPAPSNKQFRCRVAGCLHDPWIYDDDV